MLVVVATLLLLVGARGGVAYAAEPDAPDTVGEVERLAEEARRHYKAKDFAKAVAAYVKAYQLEPAAALLYNIAFIYDRKMNEQELAIGYYRRYVAAPDAEPEVVEKVLHRIDELKIEAAEARKKPPKDDGDPDAKDGDGKDGDGKGDKVSDVVVKPPPTQVEPVSSAQFDAGVGTLVAGGVVLLGGAGLAIGAWDVNQSFKDAATVADKRGLADQGQAMSLAADVMIGVGAAATLTGIILMATAPSPQDRSGVTIDAAQVPGGAVVFVSGAL